MRKIQSKSVFGFFIRLLLLFQLYYHHKITLVGAIEPGFVSNLTNEDAENNMDFNERLKLMEDKSRYQEQEIGYLKKNAVKDRNLINQLEGRVARLEATSAASTSSLLVRPKRPFRLLPITSTERIRDKTNIEDNNLQFYGPASNCDELGKLGYTLNGYYLVKNCDLPESSSIKAVVDVVFCQFQHALQGSTIAEEKLGSVALSKMADVITHNEGTQTNKPNMKSTISDIVNAVTPSTKNVFDSSSSTALIKRVGQQSSCISLWKLEIGEPLRCLAVEHIKISNFTMDRVVLGKCDNQHTTEHKWSMIVSGNAGMRICQDESGKCLTYDSKSFAGHPNISLKKRDKEAKDQLFHMNIETSQLVIVESGSCVMGLLRSSPYVPGLKVQGCNEPTDSITYKKWSVVPLKNC